ncbi:MAG TPA: SDR family oxidoreductase [Pseudoxanthomonas mexicana]|nr:SDR family oxidoreductase [Pseudoxanthomonas mexicana]
MRHRVYDAVAQAGAEPLLYPLDLEGASPDDYAELADRLRAELGHLDGVLHCAVEFKGLTPLEHTDPAAFARVMHVNLTAPWWLSQACLPLLRQAQDAALVFALDDLERVGQPYWGAYGIAQHGLAAMVGMLHAELASSSVRVSALQPGPMRTGLRSRAYADDNDLQAREATDYADACVTLLSSAGATHRGQVWKVRA